jgi:hypothetical protein
MSRLHTRTGPNRFAPRVELLDDRVVPSCTWETVGNVLTITGDSSANDIQIVDDGTTLTITCDGESVDVADGVTEVVVKAGSGNDTVSYELTSGGAAAVERTIDVQLGNGWDTFDGSVTGDLFDGSALSVEARGGNGKDTVNFVVDGGVGTGATLDVLLGGGNGKDVIESSYAGVLLGDLVWDVTGGNGKDEAGAEMTFDAGSTGTADVSVFGERAPDALTLLVTDNSGDDGDPATEDDSALGESTFEVDGGKHNDTADVSDVVDVVSAKEV